MTRKLVLDTNTAKKIVSEGTGRVSKSIQTIPKSIPDVPVIPDGTDIRLARLQSAWTLNSAGLWVATACFIVNDRADPSFIFDVYAPMLSTQPEGRARSTRFYVVWRDRWELLSFTTSVPAYTSGDGISVFMNATSGGYTIENSGVVSAKIPSNTYVDHGTLYFNNGTFEWSPSTLDIVGKYELRVKTRRISVVTNVVLNSSGHLELTTETVNVIG